MQWPLTLPCIFKVTQNMVHIFVSPLQHVQFWINYSHICRKRSLALEGVSRSMTVELGLYFQSYCDSGHGRRSRGQQLGHPDIVRGAWWPEDEAKLPPTSILNQEYRIWWVPCYCDGNVVSLGHQGHRTRGVAPHYRHNWRRGKSVCCAVPIVCYFR